MQVQLLPGALDKARSSIGTGRWPLKPERRVQLPHGPLKQHDHVVELADTRRSERRALAALGVRASPWSLTQCRRGRCPTGFHTAGRPVRYRGLQLRVGVGSTGSHKPGPPGATPGPATTGYANRHSGQFERLVTVGSSPTSVTGMIPWSSGNDAWATARKTTVRVRPGSLDGL